MFDRDKYKYRLKGGMGHRVEFALDKKPKPELAKHVNFPENITRDVITFTGKYVESHENLNMAYFANEELVKAYHSIPYKALDVEHNLEEIVGHFYSHVFVDRATNEVVSYEELVNMRPVDLIQRDYDVLVGGVVYSERFPRLEGPMERKSYALSMEVLFSTFDVLLENGIRLTLKEAETHLGLDFIEQLMGEFKSEEDFNTAHSLLVTLAGGESMKMKVYKYLKDMIFSGGGLVLNPACPSCHILGTDRDNCGCEEKMAASASKETENTETTKQFSFDLREYEPYMEKMREKEGKPINYQVAENIDNKKKEKDNEEQAGDLNDQVTSPAPHAPTPDPNGTTNSPATCPQYKPTVWVREGQGDTVEDVEKQHWCMYANEPCEVAGNRQDRSCHRWYREWEDWVYDTRNFKDDVYSPKDREEEPVNTEVPQIVRAGLENIIDYHHYSWESQIAEINYRREQAAWSTKYINDLPNSSFAVVEKGYKEGESPKSARHLPFKDKEGNVDLPHLRNALARMNQVKSVLGTETSKELRDRAKRKLTSYAKRYLPTTSMGD